MFWEADRQPGPEMTGQSQSSVSKEGGSPTPTWSLRGAFMLGTVIAITVATEILLTSGGAQQSLTKRSESRSVLSDSL